MKRFNLKVATLFTLIIVSLSVFGQSPVTSHGALSVSGNRIVNQYGDTVSFAGNSMFWSNTGWEGAPFYNASCVSWLQSDWNATIVRAAMGVEDNGGFLSDTTNKTRLKAVVDAAIANDMYVIIDWHSHHAEQYQSQAIAFFQEMATLYGGYDNVIYEIYNEPLQVSWSNTIKPYATAVISAIRAIDPDNLIVVGTPTWSQDVDVASLDPITGYSNIAYTLHFYAGTHGQTLRNKALTAMNNGIALFVTEWGTVNANGNGGVATTSVNEWANFMCQNKLSHCNWSVCDKNEGASIVTPGSSPFGNWSASNLTASGSTVKSIVQTWDANCNAQVSLVANDAGISNIADPVGDVCSDSISPEITLNNYGSNSLSSVTINYSIDNGPNSVYLWNGTLLPGQSETINLPSQYVSSGVHSLAVTTNLPNGSTDSVSVNNSESSTFNIMGPGVLAQFSLQTDCWGSEVTWTLEDSQNSQIASGGGYPNGAAGYSLVEQYCLVDSCYTFTINDSYGDGLNGIPSGCPINGYYHFLNVDSGDTLAPMLAMSGAYGYQEVNTFCLSTQSPCSITASANVSNESCATLNDGSITVTPTNGGSGYTYSMAGVSQSTGTFSNLQPGTYQISVADANGCQTVLTETVTAAVPFGSVDGTQTICQGEQISIGAYGGNSYVWSLGGSQIGMSNSVLVSPNNNETYTVSITNGACTEDYTLNVIVNSNPDASFSSADFCENQNNVITNIATSGGSFSHDGSDGSYINSSTGVISNAVGGSSYQVTYVVTQNGCTGQYSEQISVSQAPQVDAGSTVSVCSGDSAVLVALNPNNAQLSWTNNVVDGVPFVPSSSGTYTVTALLNGCNSSDIVFVNVIQAPTISAGNDISVCLGDDVTLTAINPNNAQLSWTNNVADGVPFTPTAPTTIYTVSGTLNGCTSSDEVVVSTTTPAIVDAGVDQTSCASESVTLSAYNPDNAALSWNNGVTDRIPFTVQTGVTIYSVSANLNGCISTDQITITGMENPTLSAQITNDDGNNSGAIDLSIQTSSNVASILWSNNETTEDIDNLSAGTYSVTVIDQNGCSVIDTFLVHSSVFLNEIAHSMFSLYPNPVNGVVTIEHEGEFEIEILDTKGRMVKSLKGVDLVKFDTSLLSSGTYFVRSTITNRIVKMVKP